MPSTSYLTIEGFLRSGMNFKTEVKDWDFLYSTNQSTSWSWKTKIEKPLIVKRRVDQYSNKFAQSMFYRMTFPEATLTVDETGRPGSLLKRVIYDFTDLKINSYTKLGTYENIHFYFATASVFESAVEKITSP